MIKRLTISSAVALACLLSIVQPSRALGLQKNYVITGRPIENAAEAVVEARRFMLPKLEDSQKCQRLAVVLHAFKEASPEGKPNQFDVAGIVLSPHVKITNRYDKINVELLRDLYIDATKLFLVNKHVDASIVELMNCLKAGFKQRDIVARNFLNDPELNTVVEQFESISQQPLSLLQHGDARRHGLDLSNYHDAVKSTIRTWVADDSQKISQLFGDHMEQEDIQYMETLFGSLIAVYDLLHRKIPLPDRCEAYSRLFQAKKDELYRGDFVHKFVAETAERVKNKEPSEGDFKPDEDARADFLFAVANFDPRIDGPEVWLDLNDCVEKWADEDEDVRIYLESEYRAELMDRLGIMEEPQLIAPTGGVPAPDQESSAPVAAADAPHS